MTSPTNPRIVDFNDPLTCISWSILVFCIGIYFGGIL